MNRFFTLNNLPKNDLVYSDIETDSESINSDMDNDKTHLNSEWTMFYRDHNTKSTSSSPTNEDFSNDMVDLISCNTISNFWQIMNAIPFPSSLNRRTNSSYMFFRKNIQPTWEDANNQNGGMWRIVIKKHEDRSKYLDTFWLELLMALVGEQFRHSLDITGCVVKRRQKEDRIELWTKGSDDFESDEVIQKEIGEDLKKILGLDNELEYTKHAVVKKMEDVRRAGYGDRNNIRDKSVTRKSSIIRNVSMNDVFSAEYKNRSFECRIEDRGKYRI